MKITKTQAKQVIKDYNNPIFRDETDPNQVSLMSFLYYYGFPKAIQAHADSFKEYHNNNYGMPEEAKGYAL